MDAGFIWRVKHGRERKVFSGGASIWRESPSSVNFVPFLGRWIPRGVPLHQGKFCTSFPTRLSPPAVLSGVLRVRSNMPRRVLQASDQQHDNTVPDRHRGSA